MVEDIFYEMGATDNQIELEGPCILRNDYIMQNGWRERQMRWCRFWTT